MVLSLPVESCDGSLKYGTGEEQHAAILQSYENLCKVLRNLKDLPLTINSIQGTSPVFRFAEVGYHTQIYLLFSYTMTCI